MPARTKAATRLVKVISDAELPGADPVTGREVIGSSHSGVEPAGISSEAPLPGVGVPPGVVVSPGVGVPPGVVVPPGVIVSSGVGVSRQSAGVGVGLPPDPPGVGVAPTTGEVGVLPGVAVP